MTLGGRVFGIGMVGVAMVCERLAGREGQGKDFAGIHNMSGQTQTRPKVGPKMDRNGQKNGHPPVYVFCPQEHKQMRADKMYRSIGVTLSD
mgnify:CR=1 FL=1